MKKLFLVFFSFLLTSIIFLSSPPKALAYLFYDDFESGNFAKWMTIGGNWTIQTIQGSKRAGNNVPPSSDYEIQAGDFSWSDYEFSVDVLPISGTDKNIFFRVENQRTNILSGHNLPVSYGLHMTKSLLELQKWTTSSGQMLLSSPVNFPSNEVTFLKVWVKGKEIKVYINNSALPTISYTDDTNPILNGKIALAVIAGADSSVVWYDNFYVTDLSPTPTPTPQTPIVFVPGLGGSFSFKNMFLGENNNDWIMTPGAKVYDNLLKTFEGKDYFHTFFYDWRKPVTENAQKLNDYIKNTVQPWDNKVNLLGHSLGGLVARTCIQKTADNCYADKLITVGSPQSGAVDAYPALEGGEIWRTGPTKLGFELFLHYNQRPGETRRDTLERIAPVLKDLLPDFNYLTKNGIVVPPSALSFQNSLLPQLTDLSLLENKTNTITGRNFGTIETITLKERNLFDKILGNWPDGKPDNRILTVEGDNTVLTKSASFSNLNIKNWMFDSDHAGIISQSAPLQKILDILEQDLAISTENSPDAENYLAFFVHSPVKLSLLNPPPNTYAEDEIIIVPNPENKNYQLNVQGMAVGLYQLSVGQIYGGNTFWSDYFGIAKVGETKNFSFLINPQNPKTEPLVDSGGNSTKFFVSSLVQQMRDEILKMGIEKNKQDLLIANLVLIRPNNPESSLALLGTFRNLVALYEKADIIQSDKANFLRNRSSVLAGYLETLAFSAPKSTKKNTAQSGITSAKKAQTAVKIEKLSKNALFVYMEAEEKLKKAESNFSAGIYYQTVIFSLEAKILFSEAKNIK